jgi:hypothetical protein
MLTVEHETDRCQDQRRYSEGMAVGLITCVGRSCEGACIVGRRLSRSHFLPQNMTIWFFL